MLIATTPAEGWPPSQPPNPQRGSFKTRNQHFQTVEEYEKRLNSRISSYALHIPGVVPTTVTLIIIKGPSVD